MITIRIIVIIASLAFFLSTNVNASDIEKGISEYSWGDSASKHSGLSKLGAKGEVSYYSNPGETYTIGDVTIDNVVYGFYKDQLFGIYLNIDSIDIYDTLLNHMKSQYGLPAYKTTASKLVTYKWEQQNVTIKLKMNTTTEKMKLAFYFQPFSSKVNVNQWEELDISSFHFVPIEKDKKPEEFILFKF
ncbi:hypothetical protein [Desulfogranum japonicum]|uniref:hypothetical protein n=1 Tax=Desulfogranum japonicum TaxID=231447 RepID=UPI00040DEFA7|nr:hypothetical protein [Desulfogranum japonicum]